MKEETNNSSLLKNKIDDSVDKQKELNDTGSPSINENEQQKAFNHLAQHVKVLNLLFYSLIK